MQNTIESTKHRDNNLTSLETIEERILEKKQRTKIDEVKSMNRKNCVGGLRKLSS